ARHRDNGTLARPAFGRLRPSVLAGLHAVEILDAGHRQVELPVVAEPAAPEPRQILARRTVHGTEEIRRRRLLEGPGFGVLAESRIEPLRPQYLVAQQGQAVGRLEVSDRVAVRLLDGTGARQDRRR